MDKGLLHKKATALFCHIWLAGNGLDPHDNDYFITICTRNKRHLFGHPHMLSPWGKIAEDELLAIEKHFDQVPTVWQKTFYDRIIRNQADHNAIWTYIDENPAKREQDNYD